MKKTPLAAAFRTTTFLLPVAAVVAGSVVGCSSYTQTSGAEEGPAYPTLKKQTRSLDVQVSRDDTVITFTNTTARDLPACVMWINAFYSHPVPAVAIGQSVQLNLGEFKDQYGDVFRAGGFFASDRPMRLVLAQLEMENELVGLVVVGDYD